MGVWAFELGDNKRHLIHVVLSLRASMNGRKHLTIAVTCQEMNYPCAYEEAVLEEAHYLYEEYFCAPSRTLEPEMELVTEPENCSHGQEMGRAPFVQWFREQAYGKSWLTDAEAIADRVMVAEREMQMGMELALALALLPRREDRDMM